MLSHSRRLPATFVVVRAVDSEKIHNQRKDDLATRETHPKARPIPATDAGDARPVRATSKTASTRRAGMAPALERSQPTTSEPTLLLLRRPSSRDAPAPASRPHKRKGEASNQDWPHLETAQAS